MKQLFLFFCIIFYIYCLDIPFQPGIKTNGHCIKNDYIFTFKDSNTAYDQMYDKKQTFNLLMNKDVASKCKINKRIFPLNLYEIICKIENYSECVEEYRAEDINTLNFIKSINLVYSRLTLGQVLKGDISASPYNYNFTILNTKISKKIGYNKSFPLHIKINNIDLNSSCTIINDTLEFNMDCSIEKDFPIDDNNYEILLVEGNYTITDDQNKIYYSISQNKSTTTLNAGYIIKGTSCSNGLYKFTIYDNIITGDEIESDKENLEFNLKLEQFANKAICSFNLKTQLISCSIKVNEKEKQYCENIYKDIKIENINDGKNYIYIDNNILHLNGFKGLETTTIEAGELYKGKCNNNKYEFKFSNSIAYNVISEEYKFNLKLKKPEVLTAICYLKKVSKNRKFDIICYIEGKESCPIYDEKIDLEIQNNPGDIVINKNKRIKFKNFDIKSTMVSVKAGKLKKQNFDKENKIYTIIFIDSSINYQYILDIDIKFKIKLKTNENERETACTFEKETKNNITCEIENIELDLDDINIEIINTPKDDYYSLADKTIIFEDFEGKKINTLIAGKIEDIGCNGNIYTFAFNNSKSAIKLEKEFYLKMENPSERKAKCNVNSNSNTEILSYDIICIIEGSTTCPIDIGTNIIVANEEPEPIEINDTTILYLSSFEGQNTIKYNISVGTLSKLVNKSEDEECKYYFGFSHEPFIFKFFPGNISFDIDIYFNGNKEKKEKARCILFKTENNDTELTCYYVVDSNICELSYYDYDIKIGENVDVEELYIEDCSRKIKLEGFNNKETITILAGNIEDKFIEDRKFIFIIKNNKNKYDNEFNLILTLSEGGDIYNATCIFNEENNIKCKLEKKTIK